MLWRIVRFLWTASRGHHLTPWRSPYLRWRIETYWGIDAAEIDARAFWRFCREHWRDLWRFLRWAAELRG